MAKSTEKNNDFQQAESHMALGKKNLILMLVGFGIIVLGFILMAGGGSDDPNVFNEARFSCRRITIAPILVIGGFVFEIYAIMKRFK